MCADYILLGVGPSLKHGQLTRNYTLKEPFLLPSEAIIVYSYPVRGRGWWTPPVSILECWQVVASVSSWVQQFCAAQKTLLASTPFWPLALTIFPIPSSAVVPEPWNSDWRVCYIWSSCGWALHWHLVYALWLVVHCYSDYYPHQRNSFDEAWKIW